MKIEPINPSTEMPRYLQVENALRGLIENGDLLPGDQIPSERELAERIGASRMTVRHAVEKLLEHGLLERRSTAGTFVSSSQVVRKVDDVLGISQLLHIEGAQPGSCLLLFEDQPATAKIAERLQIKPDEAVVVIKRLRLVNDKPFCVETSTITRSLVPDLIADDINANQSLYRYMRERHEIVCKNSIDTIRISYATEEEAAYLGLKVGTAIMLFQAIVFDEHNHPVEFLKSVNHPERVVFQSRMMGSK